MDADLLRLLEEEATRIQELDPSLTTRVIARSVAPKGQVVSEDERESGRRIILNYGHTVAHGIEAATAYSSYLHGEAVAIGMTAAARISRRMGLLAPEVEARQRELIEAFHLPTRASGLDPRRVLAAMALDKKVRAKAIRWVLLAGVGMPVVRSDVPDEFVQEAVSYACGEA
ncbi:MAG TPA: 3-dehydroquinate synthase, partial [Dehalococcoidia bacterium]|nr:3-dehydroquinate synthase [Dehalococcoidia bacterium]